MKTITLPQRNFPLTTNALKFMQEAYGELEKLALLGGDNYILSGCVVIGGSVSAGWVVLNGILAPFRAGTIQAYVDLGDPKTTVVVGTGTRVETNYIAYFSSSPGSYTKATWADLNLARPDSLLALKAAMASVNTRLDTNVEDLSDDIVAVHNEVVALDGIIEVIQQNIIDNDTVSVYENTQTSVDFGSDTIPTTGNIYELTKKMGDTVISSFVKLYISGSTGVGSIYTIRIPIGLISIVLKADNASSPILIQTGNAIRFCNVYIAGGYYTFSPLDGLPLVIGNTFFIENKHV